MKFTLTFEGDTNEALDQLSSGAAMQFFKGLIRLDLQETLRQLVRDLDNEQSQETQSSGHGDMPWKQEELENAWSSFRPGAKQILTLIAQQPEGCSMQYIQDELEKTDGKRTERKGIGGRLSSVNVAFRDFPNRHRIYVYDAPVGEYRMTSDIAAMIKEIVGSSAGEIRT